MGGPIQIDPEELRRLYVDKRLSIVETAARVGCSPTTIGRRLYELGVRVRPRGPDVPRSSSIDWSPEVAYAVGLIATDGNLSRDGRHLTMSSKDVGLLETFRSCLGLRAQISKARGGSGSRSHCIQWSHRSFYEFLVSIGLTPAKSLTLGPLRIPAGIFADFLRGCIDGDGSVSVYTDRYHASKNPKYVYQRLYVVLFSASPAFLLWIRDTVERLVGVHGAVEVRREAGRSPAWCLRYAKRESLVVLRWIYYAPQIPCLERKRVRAEAFLSGRRDGIL
jgi:hypothetical protein